MGNSNLYDINNRRKTNKKNVVAIVILSVILAVFLLVYSVILFFVDLFYLFAIWDDRYNTIVLDNLTSEQIQLVEEEARITIPEDAVNIKLTLDFSDYNEKYYLYYETPEINNGTTIQLYNHYSGNLTSSPLSGMIYDNGQRQVLPWYIEISILNSIIGAIMVIILSPIVLIVLVIKTERGISNQNQQ